MSSLNQDIPVIRTIKATRGDALVIDLGKTFLGTLTAWLKKDPLDATYRAFEIDSNRYLRLTQDKTVDYYDYDSGVLLEAVGGRWFFDVEQLLDGQDPEESKTIYKGSILFENDITNSVAIESVQGEGVFVSLAGKENKIEKGVPNGYAPLGGDGLVPLEFLPIGDQGLPDVLAVNSTMDRNIDADRNSIDNLADATSLQQPATLNQLNEGVEQAQDYTDDQISQASLGFIKDQGGYNPLTNSNLYPNTGVILKGFLYTIGGLAPGTSTTMGTQTVSNGDVVRALTNSPGQVESNWTVTENNIGYVAENQDNKTQDIATNTSSTTLYGSVKAWFDYLVGMTWLTGQIFGTWMAGQQIKITPTAADGILVYDTADGNKAKRILLSGLATFLRAIFDSIYISQQEVLEYETLAEIQAAFPVGTAGIIYVATNILTTGIPLYYIWNGSVYVTTAQPIAGITGLGATNTVPKFTPNGITLGSSRFSDNGTTGRYGSLTNYVELLSGGNIILKLFREQAQLDFSLGNPSISQENLIHSENTFGTIISTKGFLSLRAGVLAATEGIRVLSTGQILISQTPTTGLNTDKVLLRDSSGNIKQIDVSALVTAPTIDTVPTDGSSNAVQSNGVFDNLALKLNIQAASTTGVVISFTNDRVYGTIASPETGNITANVTGGLLGVTNIVIHNSGTAPTFGAQFKKLSGSGSYVTSVVNYIYCTYITSTEIIYSINQRT